MKAWKINLADYSVPLAPPVRDEEGVLRSEANFNVKESLAQMLFNPELRLSIDQSFEAKDLADKIRSSKDGVLVDQKEMEMLRRSYNVVKSPKEHEMEFFKRIRDAEEVKVEEVIKGG